MINTKDNIWTKGFDTEKSAIDFIKTNLSGHNTHLLIWTCKTSDIPEDIANKCVLSASYGLKIKRFYKSYQNSMSLFTNAKESIQSALTKPDGTIFEFCIIFKK